MSGFLGQAVTDVGGELTAAVGLSFLKHLTMGVNLPEDDKANDSHKKQKT